MKNDLVSIITPAYNIEDCIEECIVSVQKQSYSNWELIIIDDCSSDKTVDIVEKYSVIDNRIVLLRNNQNSGVAITRNKGIKHANGRYIAFLDSDDLWKENKLLQQIGFMKENNYAFTFTSYDMFYNNNLEDTKKVIVPEMITYTDYLKNTIIGCLTVVIDRDQVKDLMMPDEPLEDVKTWMKLLKNGINAFGINESLALYRVGVNTASSNKIKNACLYFKCLRNHERINFLKSVKFEFYYVLNAVLKRIR